MDLTRFCQDVKTRSIPWLPEGGAAPDDSPYIQGARERAQTVLARLLDYEGAAVFDLPWDKFVRTALRIDGREQPDNPHLLARAFSGGDLSIAIGAIANSVFVGGYDSQTDTTADWTSEIPAKNFQPFDVFGLKTGATLQRISRGGTARHAAVGLRAEGVRLARFGRQYVIDETDLIDSQDSLATWLRPLEELGRAARRLRPDLVYALILANPSLVSDSLPLFEAGTHANLGTSALDVAALGVAVGAVAGQVIADERGRVIHPNLVAKVLVVPPLLWKAGREAESNLWVGDDRGLTVLAESRLGPAGLTDPATDQTYTGSDTNWLVAAAPQAAPAIAVCYLNDQRSPRIRQRELTKGQWGMAFDIDFAVGAAALDYRGVYFSTGGGA